MPGDVKDNDSDRDRSTVRPTNGISIGSHWIESNSALARLVEQHRQHLPGATAIAMNIQTGLDTLTSVMETLSRRTCRFCPEPCCINNTVWFDFRDLLFLHLLKAPIPDCQAAMECGVPCPYLTHHGCRLSPWRRPWMCIQYLCPTQIAILEKKGQSDLTALSHKVKKIEKQRLEMETEVIRQIKRRMRTCPSSSSACSV